MVTTGQVLRAKTRGSGSGQSDLARLAAHVCPFVAGLSFICGADVVYFLSMIATRYFICNPFRFGRFAQDKPALFPSQTAFLKMSSGTGFLGH
jgi:hypothetical protein